MTATKNDNYHYHDSWKSDNFRMSNQEKKQRTDTINEAKNIKSDTFKRSNREKSNIATAILKIELLDSTIIISYFGAPIIFSPTVEAI